MADTLIHLKCSAELKAAIEERAKRMELSVGGFIRSTMWEIIRAETADASRDDEGTAA